MAPSSRPTPTAAAPEASWRRAELQEVRGRMMAVVRREAPPWLVDQAEDIVQTALMRVLTFLSRGGEEPVPSASYFTRAARNALIDEVRRRFRRPETALEERAAMAVEREAVGGGGRAEARDWEIQRGLRECLGGLAPARRRAVTLHLLGHTIAESGRALGFSAKKVEHLIYRGLADLRECLLSKGLTP